MLSAENPPGVISCVAAYVLGIVDDSVDSLYFGLTKDEALLQALRCERVVVHLELSQRPLLVMISIALCVTWS
jgi:hypothetical protein